MRFDVSFVCLMFFDVFKLFPFYLHKNIVNESLMAGTGISKISAVNAVNNFEIINNAVALKNGAYR